MSEEKMNTAAAVLPYLRELVEGINPQFLLGLLKENDDVAATVLRGFRSNVQSVKTPIVRQRLIAEAELNPLLIEKLSIAWIDSNRTLWGHIALGSVKEIKNSIPELSAEFGMSLLRVALLLDDRQTVRLLSPKLPAMSKDSVVYVDLPHVEDTITPKPVQKKHSPDPSISAEQVDSENKQLKSKVKSLENRIKELDRQIERHRTEAERHESEIKSFKKQLADSRHQIEKSEKVADRMHRAKESVDSEKILVERELKKARIEIQNLRARHSANQVAEKTAQKARTPDWVTVVSSMLNNGLYDSARIFCETVKSSEPDNLHAHLVLEHVYAKTDACNKQIEESLWLADHLNRHRQPVRACTFICRALEIDPSNRNAYTQFKSILAKIKTTDDSAVSAVHSLLNRLKTSNPSSYREMRKILRQMGEPWLRMAEGRSGSLHPDKVFDLSDGSRSAQMSIRRIIEAVDSNEASVVTFVRRAMPKLRKENPNLYRSIAEGLEAHDGSCMAALSRGTHPVIVDGSNVAWHETDEKPRLKNILDLRSELRAEGYYPVYIYVDAALPYQVDQQSTLQELIDAGAVVAACSHTDADEEITRQARVLSCPVVTNDRMADWDPQGDIPKLRFTIDRFGITLYER